MTQTQIERIPAFESLDGLENHTDGQLGTPWLMFDPRDSSMDIEFRRPSDNGCPMDVWHGIVRRWNIDPRVDFEALANEINNGTLDEHINALVDGHEIIWDGSNNVGRLNDAARSADDAIGRWLDEAAPRLAGENAGLWDASEWLDAVRSEIKERFDAGESLTELADAYDADARVENVVLYGTDEFIRRVVDDE